MNVDFNKLVGQKAQLYKRTELNTFQLGEVIFEVIEDPSDGYRSSMESVEIIDVYFLSKEFLAEITITKELEIFKLIDAEGNLWLEFGTLHYDAYYPCFIFNPYHVKDLMSKINTKL